jgi:hypothetical protein
MSTNLNDEHYDNVATLASPVEASLLSSLLQAQGIPHRIVDNSDTAYDGLFQFSKGWGCVLAPLRYKAAVLTALADVHSSDSTQ